MTLAENIKRLRESKGKTQKEVAAFMGISQQAYSQYESGKREPKFDTIRRIADAIGASMPELLRIVMDCDENFVNAEWFGEMSDNDLVDVFISSPADPAMVDRINKELMRSHELHNDINSSFACLNLDGQEEAAKRVWELTQIPKYRHHPTAEPTPDAPAAPDDKEPTQK